MGDDREKEAQRQRYYISPPISRDTCTCQRNSGSDVLSFLLCVHNLPVWEIAAYAHDLLTYA
jgi:hypothetical protein